MYTVEDCKLKASWNLAHPDQNQVEISKEKLKYLDHHDLLAISFMFQNYNKNYKGAVLNEQNGFNMQLQVSVFLNVMFRYVEQKFITLILAPDYLVGKWYQYLTDIADLVTIKISAKTCPADFDDKHGVALLISFDDLNLLEHLIGYNFFAVVIDCFDEVAKKMVIKKRYGDFHIGLTTRNFYFNPDQKLQWMMIKWCCPDACGESKDFCKFDNDNFANFRDNYRHWWFRLTGHFCESLKDLVGIEKGTDIRKSVKTTCSRNHKKTKRTAKSDNKSPEEIMPKEEYMETEPLVQNEYAEKEASGGSTDKAENAANYQVETTELDTVIKAEDTRNFLATDHDDPINLLLSQNSQHEFPTDEIPPVRIKTEDKQTDNADDILLSLIDGESNQTTDFVDPETEFSVKKEEIASQIFAEFPSCSSRVSDEEGSEFLMSLID